MKILSSQATKVIPLPSENCSLALRLSPNYNDLMPDALPLPRNNTDGTHRFDNQQINIYTHDKKFRARKCLNKDKDKVDCHTCTEDEFISDTCQCKSPLTNVSNKEMYSDASINRGFLKGISSSVKVQSPLLNHQDVECLGSMTPPQFREYRKHLSVRLGSLKWSFQVVMVVKSKSSSRLNEITADKSTCKSNSRTRKVIPEEKRRLLTQSYTNLLQVDEDYLI